MSNNDGRNASKKTATIGRTGNAYRGDATAQSRMTEWKCYDDDNGSLVQTSKNWRQLSESEVIDVCTVHCLCGPISKKIANTAVYKAWTTHGRKSFSGLKLRIMSLVQYVPVLHAFVFCKAEAQMTLAVEVFPVLKPLNYISMNLFVWIQKANNRNHFWNVIANCNLKCTNAMPKSKTTFKITATMALDRFMVGSSQT